uniref:Uncharacterized protein n=6 Tax=Aegilops tauschii subsp. strangulata TaxID=200361 RepID=A0A453LB66_AEGTS
SPQRNLHIEEKGERLLSRNLGTPPPPLSSTLSLPSRALTPPRRRPPPLLSSPPKLPTSSPTLSSSPHQKIREEKREIDQVRRRPWRRPDPPRPQRPRQGSGYLPPQRSRPATNLSCVTFTDVAAHRRRDNEPGRHESRRHCLL